MLGQDARAQLRVVWNDHARHVAIRHAMPQQGVVIRQPCDAWLQAGWHSLAFREVRDERATFWVRRIGGPYGISQVVLNDTDKCRRQCEGLFHCVMCGQAGTLHRDLQVGTTRQRVRKDIGLAWLVLDAEVILRKEGQPSRHALRQVWGIGRSPQGRMVGVHDEGLAAQQVYPKLQESILDCK